MASQNDTEIEIEWLKNEIIPKLLKQRKLLSDLNESDFDQFQIENITIDFIGSQEAFMLTKCYRARVTYNLKGSVEEINFFVKKTPPLPQEIFDAVNFKALFTNEILAYEKIIPALEEFANLNLKTAKFYYADLESNAATLITEDFTRHDWRLTKEKVNLSLDHTLLAIRYLAKFHAAGFALRATNKTQFDSLTEGLFESRYANEIDHPQYVLQIKCGMDRTLKVSREHEKDIPEEYLQKYENLLSNYMEYARKLVKPQEPFVTLCHGDFLRNNVAYKYEVAEGDDKCQPIDFMMFDLQTLRVASPMIDLTTFLGLSTFAEMRSKHFKEIFQAYCEQLKESYESFSQLPVPEYLSFNSLLKEYIKCLPNIVFTTSWFLAQLVEPLEMSAAEMLTQQKSDEDVIADCMTRGGAVMDRELAHQMKEMYDLAKEHNVDICI